MKLRKFQHIAQKLLPDNGKSVIFVLKRLYPTLWNIHTMIWDVHPMTWNIHTKVWDKPYTN